MHRSAQILVGIYCAIVLITWPVLLAFWKYMFGGSWRAANRQCWARWNEIRRNPYAL